MLTTREKQCMKIVAEEARATQKEICKNCKWWRIHPSDLDCPERDKTINQCCRYPPRNFNIEDNDIQAYFPDTHDLEGCGEFKKR